VVREIPSFWWCGEMGTLRAEERRDLVPTKTKKPRLHFGALFVTLAGSAMLSSPPEGLSWQALQRLLLV
jgi:hypothetical protein